MVLYTVYKKGKGIAALAKRTDFHAHCQGRVKVPYINKAIDNAHYIVAALQELTGSLGGFACVRVRSKDLYVSALCSHGNQGLGCMQQVYLLAKLLGKQQVVLDSITSAVPFYEHIGFSHKQNRKNSKGLFRMHRDV